MLFRSEDTKTYLAKLIPLCDEIYFYDNTTSFRQVAVICDGAVVDADSDVPLWLESINIF